MKIISSLVIVLTLGTGWANLRAQPADQVYQETKKYLEIYGSGADPDPNSLRARAAFLAKGRESIPALFRLYHENPDDDYRVSVLSLLRQMEGEKAEAVQLIDSELAKDPSEWIGRAWLNMAVLLLDGVDPGLARKAYVRITEVDENRDALMMAATMLGKVGRLEDVAALEHLIERRKQVPIAKGLTGDGVSFRASAAIKAIKARAQTPKP